MLVTSIDQAQEMGSSINFLAHHKGSKTTSKVFLEILVAAVYIQSHVRKSFT